jgi:hypothetical protein
MSSFFPSGTVLADFVVTTRIPTFVVPIAPTISATKTALAANPNPTFFPQFTLGIVAKAPRLVGDGGGTGVAHVRSTRNWICVCILAVGGAIAFVAATMNRDGIMTHDSGERVWFESLDTV